MLKVAVFPVNVKPFIMLSVDVFFLVFPAWFLFLIILRLLFLYDSMVWYYVCNGAEVTGYWGRR